MAGWIVFLVLTNLLTLGALALLWHRHRGPAPSEDTHDVFTAPRPGSVTSRSRRLITIEVLNPIELTATRGRMASLAGSLVPGLARRVVNDQVLKTLRRELADKRVVADVQLHHLRPVPKPATASFDAPPPIYEAAAAEFDEVTAVDIEGIGEIDQIDGDQL